MREGRSEEKRVSESAMRLQHHGRGLSVGVGARRVAKVHAVEQLSLHEGEG